VTKDQKTPVLEQLTRLAAYERAQSEVQYANHPETARHGACTFSGPPVQDASDATFGLLPRVRRALARRRYFGRVKYGDTLRVGWPKADQALVQELLDAIDYALTGRRKWLARLLGLVAWGLLRKLDKEHT
jgi:hypothetical protein